jgi:hypothetical protein
MRNDDAIPEGTDDDSADTPSGPALGAVLAVPAVLTCFTLAFVTTLLVDGVAAFSARENRRLAGWPTLTLETVLEGSYTRDIDRWLVDHFPLRDALLDLAAELRRARGLDGDVQAFAADALADFGLQPPPPRATTTTADDSRRVDDDDRADNDDDDRAAAAPGASPAPEARVDGAAPGDSAVDVPDEASVPDGQRVRANGRGVRQRQIVVFDDRALMLQEGDDDDARAFARALNAWAKALPDVRLAALITPTASHFYLPDEWRARSAPQDQNLAAVQAALAPRIAWVDVTAALAPHVDETIFYRTDHHWTARGAWYAYAAWARVAGVRPVQLDELERRVHPPSLGSLYRITQARALHDRADPVEYWLPAVDYSAERWLALDQGPRPIRFIVEERANYATFLGGDDPLLIARTRAGTGRRVLLVKNSYGNALAPWLLPHFDEVIVVDYRSYVGDVVALARVHGITDVILQNATVTMNARSHARRMRELIPMSP